MKILNFLNDLFQSFFYIKEINFYYSDIYFSILDSLFLIKLYYIRTFKDLFVSLTLTIYLGFLFLGFQYVEYKYYATFEISNAYGSAFYMLTCLHGLHVYVGLIALATCYSFLLTLPANKSMISKNYYSNFIFTFAV